MIQEIADTGNPHRPVVAVDIARYPEAKTALLAHTLNEFCAGMMVLPNGLTAVFWLPSIATQETQVQTAARAKLFRNEASANNFSVERVVEWTRKYETDTLPLMVVLEQDQPLRQSALYSQWPESRPSGINAARELAVPRLIAYGLRLPLERIARQILSDS